VDKNKWDQPRVKLVSQAGVVVVYFCFAEHVKKYFSMHSNMRKFAIIFLTASRNQTVLKCLVFLHLVQTSATFENYFIHNSKRSLNRVLLHNGNTSGSVSLG